MVEMGELARIGVAIDGDLTGAIRFLSMQGADTRIVARHSATLIRDALIQESTEAPDNPVVGTLTLIYDHHVRMLSDRLTEMQHEHHHEIISTLHVHLDHDHCLEVLVLRGLQRFRAQELRIA